MQWLQRAPVKEALLILYLVADGGNLADRVVSLGLSPWLGIFTIFYVAFVGALWVASRLASSLLRWAIGVLLWEALAGRHPFWRGSMLETARALIVKEIAVARRKSEEKVQAEIEKIFGAN